MEHESICQTCKNCLQYNTNESVPTLDLKFGNTIAPVKYFGPLGANCSVLGFWVVDVQECSGHEPKEEPKIEDDDSI